MGSVATLSDLENFRLIWVFWPRFEEIDCYHVDNIGGIIDLVNNELMNVFDFQV